MYFNLYLCLCLYLYLYFYLCFCLYLHCLCISTCVCVCISIWICICITWRKVWPSSVQVGRAASWSPQTLYANIPSCNVCSSMHLAGPWFDTMIWGQLQNNRFQMIWYDQRWQWKLCRWHCNKPLLHQGSTGCETNTGTWKIIIITTNVIIIINTIFIIIMRITTCS